ncbi:hypothetical protein BpHYR1_051110 [Brachionus plicatilis]|uniref:Uncharacterized protein n=1 Tax=Brachionus plicatilis TaxID=10195 RepID=A0A3M7PBD1_BRAPC|nr:hypothetical protein BpHYR1_051110 [Brachionus plicatilis]
MKSLLNETIFLRQIFFKEGKKKSNYDVLNIILIITCFSLKNRHMTFQAKFKNCVGIRSSGHLTGQNFQKP